MSPRHQIVSRWIGELPVYIYCLACAGFCVSLWAKYGINYNHSDTILSFALIGASGLLLLAFYIATGLWRDRPLHPFRWVRDRYLTKASLLAFVKAIPTLAICAALIPVFSSLKSMIPLLNAFTWDATFIAWDRAIFFGYDPWRLLQPILGYPLITAAIAGAYHLWILFLYLGVVVIAMSHSLSDDLRRRFFLSYALAWSVVGGLMAIMFASVGPIFAEPLVGIDLFKDQVDYLRSANEQVPVLTIPVQDMLLDRFQNQQGGIGRGITAMPSMHIAIAVLFWLTAREVSHRAGRFFFWYMILIWVGSVHTAYHYAVDGLVSLLAIWIIWKAVPFVFAGWDALTRQLTLRTKTVPAE